jgi:hypothetical protein
MHLGEAPALILARVGTDRAKPTLTTRASINPAAQNIMRGARGRPWELHHHHPPSTATRR